MTARESPTQQVRRPRRVGVITGVLLPWILGVSAFSLALLLAAIAVVLLGGSWPALHAATFRGADVWPAILGSLVAASLGLVIALPVALALASFVTEFASTAMSRLVSAVLDIAAVVPAVVFGLWGLFVLAPMVSSAGGSATGLGLASAGVVLAVMLVPYVAALARDLFASVPSYQREAALAVGATRWEVMTKVVLPQVRLGLLGAVALGLARAFGETVAVMMVIGQAAKSELSLLEPAATAATTIARGLAPDMTAERASVLVALAGLLFTVTLGMLVAGRLLVQRVEQRGGAA